MPAKLQIQRRKRHSIHWQNGLSRHSSKRQIKQAKGCWKYSRDAAERIVRTRKIIPRALYCALCIVRQGLLPIISSSMSDCLQAKAKIPDLWSYATYNAKRTATWPNRLSLMDSKRLRRPTATTTLEGASTKMYGNDQHNKFKPLQSLYKTECLLAFKLENMSPLSVWPLFSTAPPLSPEFQ